MKTPISQRLKVLAASTVAVASLLASATAAAQSSEGPLQERLESLLPDTPVVQQIETYFDGQPPATVWAKAWGDPSGDQVVPGFGLVLELLHGDSDEPRLRLSGGLPGHAAVVFVADEPDGTLDAYGTWNIGETGGPLALVDKGAKLLLPDDAQVLTKGSFDWRGTFEMPWPGQPEGTEVWVQGVESGGYFAQGSASTQMSHALQVRSGVQVTDHTNKPLLPAPLPPSLPVQGAKQAVELFTQMDEFSDVALPRLDGLLAKALVYEGDALSLTLKVKGSGMYSGVTVGATVGGSFEIRRVSGNRFVVSMAGQLSGGAGLKAAENLSVTAQSARKISKEFRFHSIQGLGRGLRALLMGDTSTFKKGAFINVIDDLLLARDEAAARLAALDPQIQLAKKAVSKLAQKVKTKVGQTAFGPALAKAKKALQKLETKHDQTRVVVEQTQEELGAYAGQVRMAALIAQALVQGKMFVQDHLFAVEYDYGLSSVLKLGLPCPVQTGTAGASLGIRAPSYLPRTIVRMESMTEPRGIAYTLTLRYDGQIQGFLGNGLHAVEGTIVPAVQLVARAQIPVGEAAEAVILLDVGELCHTVLDDLAFETKTEVIVDVSLAGRKGLVGYRELGVGKTWQLSMGNEHSAGEYVDALAAFLETGDIVELLAPMGSRTVTYGAQGRRVRGFGAKLIIDATVAAGGLDEATAKWIDAGRKFEVDTTVAEAIASIRQAVASVEDALIHMPGLVTTQDS